MEACETEIALSSCQRCHNISQAI